MVAIPTSFTPNGDGVNDTFRVLVNSCLGRLRQLTIYDRWGQVIFHQQRLSVLDTVFTWDGRYKGEWVGTGVYGYQLTVESDLGSVSQHAGALTVIR